MSSSFNGSDGYKISIPSNASVSWSLVSQSAKTQDLKIIDPSGTKIVDTSVLSLDLANASLGSFMSGGGGQFKVKLPADTMVMVDSATINNGRTVVSESYLFAGEDATDNDYNDAFAVVTWYAKNG